MKVIFNIAEQKICIEGEGEQLVEVLKAVREVAPSISHIQIEATSTGDAKQSPASRKDRNGDSGGSSVLGTKTLKQFVRSLRLGNTAERISVIAYHMKHNENRDSFSPKEMSAWFTMCGLAKPNQMPVALFSAKKRHGYVESSGHGRFRISTNGENLVVGKLNATEGNGDEES